jgi:hypothetical protein
MSSSVGIMTSPTYGKSYKIPWFHTTNQKKCYLRFTKVWDATVGKQEITLKKTRYWTPVLSIPAIVIFPTIATSKCWTQKNPDLRSAQISTDLRTRFWTTSAF